MTTASCRIVLLRSTGHYENYEVRPGGSLDNYEIADEREVAVGRSPFLGDAIKAAIAAMPTEPDTDPENWGMDITEVALAAFNDTDAWTVHNDGTAVSPKFNENGKAHWRWEARTIDAWDESDWDAMCAQMDSQPARVREALSL